jgi:hypothetical protein
VLMAGGQNGHSFNSSLTSAELYDPATGTWAVTGSLNTSRSLHTTTLLSNGNVLVAGGNNHGSVIASAELFQGPLQQAGKWSQVQVSRHSGRRRRRLGHFTFSDPAILPAVHAPFTNDLRAAMQRLLDVTNNWKTPRSPFWLRT